MSSHSTIINERRELTIKVTYWYLPVQDSIIEVTHRWNVILGDLYEFDGGFDVKYLSPFQVDLVVPGAIQLD